MCKLVSCVGALALFTAASANAATLTVVNDCDSYVEVSVDGVHGCHTAAHTTCTIPIAPGHHHLRAVKDDDGASTETEGDIEEPGSHWTLTNERQPAN